jgi:predicted AlkP superfamily pyrophosphatase or phosphodiesterase
MSIVFVLASCQASQPDRTPKVLMIGIDGCRPDALLAAETPNLDALIADGALSVEAQTCAITSSGPSWSSLLTGTWPAKNGVTDNSFEGARFDRYPHVFVHVKAERPEMSTASFAHWAPIDEQIVAGADLARACGSAQEVEQEAVRLLSEGNPDFLFLHLDDVDHAGHEKGYSVDIPEYLAAISTADDHIGAVLTAVRQRPRYAQEDWLVLVTTDHGGSGTSHGQDIPAHRTIFLIVSGPSVLEETIEPAPGIVDAAATALYHLGIELDPAWELDGRPVAVALRSE